MRPPPGRRPSPAAPPAATRPSRAVPGPRSAHPAGPALTRARPARAPAELPLTGEARPPTGPRGGFRPPDIDPGHRSPNAPSRQGPGHDASPRWVRGRAPRPGPSQSQRSAQPRGPVPPLPSALRAERSALSPGVPARCHGQRLSRRGSRAWSAPAEAAGGASAAQLQGAARGTGGRRSPPRAPSNAGTERRERRARTVRPRARPPAVPRGCALLRVLGGCWAVPCPALALRDGAAPRALLHYPGTAAWQPWEPAGGLGTNSTRNTCPSQIPPGIPVLPKFHQKYLSSHSTPAWEQD